MAKGGRGERIIKTSKSRANDRCYCTTNKRTSSYDRAPKPGVAQRFNLDVDEHRRRPRCLERTGVHHCRRRRPAQFRAARPPKRTRTPTTSPKGHHPFPFVAPTVLPRSPHPPTRCEEKRVKRTHCWNRRSFAATSIHCDFDPKNKNEPS